MPSLLTLPRELRDEIISYAILAPLNEAPPLTATFSDLTDGRDSVCNPGLRAWGITDAIKYKLGNVPSSSASLLLVNRQLYSETVSNLLILPESRTYDLDIILLDEVLLLPTWLRVPMLTTSVDKINVTFRIAGSSPAHERYRTYGSYSGFNIGNGAGPAMSWLIYSLLERFFKVGPTGERKSDEHKHVTIKTLDINVQTPDHVDPAHFGNPGTGIRDPRNSTEHCLDPLYLVS